MTASIYAVQQTDLQIKGASMMGTLSVSFQTANVVAALSLKGFSAQEVPHHHGLIITG